MRRSCTRFYKQIFMFFSLLCFSSSTLLNIELQQAANLRRYHYRNCITISVNSWLDARSNDPWKLARDYTITIDCAGFGSCICCYMPFFVHVCHIKTRKKIFMGRSTIHRRRDGITSLFLLCEFVMITWWQ